ncbi:MAG: T9SS type A sorting domain-containing protein [Bacteroidetes bacterium]|nr:T9SS type A sorting domain-containing protein [Bacteroidota bacterium]
MIKKITLLATALFAAGMITTYFSDKGAMSNPSGSPASYTGSPGDGQNCANCHGGTSSNVAGWITSDIPGTGYIAGSTYHITVTVTGIGSKGFEVSPQNTSGVLQGTLIAGTGTHLIGSGKYVTQSSSSSSNPKTWSFQWTAPVAGTGNVTFYGAFAVTMSVTKLSTLLVQENTGVGLNEISENEVSFFPNPVKDLISVKYSLNCYSTVLINLYSIDGKKIISLFNNDQQTGEHSQQLRIKGIVDAGIYFIEINISGKSTIKKIVIE